MATTALIDVTYADANAPSWFPATESAAWLALAAGEKAYHLLAASVFFRAYYPCSFTVDEANLPDEIKASVLILGVLNSQSPLQSTSASTTGGAVVSESKGVGTLKIARTYSSGVTNSVRGRLGPVDALLASFDVDGTASYCRYRSAGAQTLVRN